MNNIFDEVPKRLNQEQFVTFLNCSPLRIERIVSRGHCSPKSGWYGQAEDEWVMVLQGEAVLEFADGCCCTLVAGSFLHIPAHRLHKVSYTEPRQDTIWLAIFFEQV